MDAPDTPTLAEYLDEWLALERTRVEPTTWRSYEDMASAYLRPHLGDRHLTELSVRDLDRLYLDLLARGGRHGRPLARRTVEYAHVVLAKLLENAVRTGLLDTNPARRASVPRVDPRASSVPGALRTWDAAQVRRFLAVTADSELHDLWRVALGTGMRRSELLGLCWDAVDLSVPQLRVASGLAVVDGQVRLKSTKTRKVRTLHLDEGTAAAIERQAPVAGGELPVVFRKPDGSPWRPQEVTDRWRNQWPRLARHDLPRLRLHDVRHTHATLLLAAGVPIKVVSERLGHSRITMTLEVYAHVLPAMDQAAADAVGDLLDAAPPSDPPPDADAAEKL